MHIFFVEIKMLQTRLKFPLAIPPPIQLLSCSPGLIHCYCCGWAPLDLLLCITFVYMLFSLSSAEGQAEVGTPDKEGSNQPKSSDGTTSS